MISSDLDKSHGFQSSFEFYRILKQFRHTFVVIFFVNKMFEISFHFLDMATHWTQ